MGGAMYLGMTTRTTETTMPTLSAASLTRTDQHRSYRDAPTAGSLWDTALGSDWPASQCGLGLLDGITVDSPATVTVVIDTPRAPFDGGYQGPRVEEILVAGRTIYAASVGYGEGYLYSLHATQVEAESALYTSDDDE